MKKLNIILIVLAILIWGFIFSYNANAQITIDSVINDLKITSKDNYTQNLPITASYIMAQDKNFEFNAVASALLLLELYFVDTQYDSVEVYRPKSNIWIKEPRKRSLEDLFHWSKKYFEEQYKN